MKTARSAKAHNVTSNRSTRKYRSILTITLGYLSIILLEVLFSIFYLNICIIKNSVKHSSKWGYEGSMYCETTLFSKLTIYESNDFVNDINYTISIGSIISITEYHYSASSRSIANPMYVDARRSVQAAAEDGQVRAFTFLNARYLLPNKIRIDRILEGALLLLVVCLGKSFLARYIYAKNTHFKRCHNCKYLVGNLLVCPECGVRNNGASSTHET